jgi:hypothetical protein
MKWLLSILFFIAVSAQGQVVQFSAPTAAVGSTTNTTSYALAAFTPSANTLLVVAVSASGTLSAGAMSGGSLTWTKKTGLTKDGANVFQIWYAKVGSSPASTTVTWTCTDDAATGAILTVVQVQNYDASLADPLANIGTASSTSTSPAAGLTSVPAFNSGILTFWTGNVNSATQSTPPTGFTEINEASYNTPASGQAASYANYGYTSAAASSYVHTATTSTSWAAYTMEIKLPLTSEPVTGLASTTDGNTYQMTPFTPAPNTLLVLFVTTGGSALASPTVTGGSLTWVMKTAYIEGNGHYIYYAKVGSTPGTTQITIDVTDAPATGAIMEVMQVSSYDEAASDPIRQAVLTLGSTNAAPTVTFGAAPSSGSAVLIGWAGSTTGGSSTPPAGFTEGDDLGISTPTLNQATAWNTGVTSTSYAFTSSASTQWYPYGVEVYAVGAGPTLTRKVILIN